MRDKISIDASGVDDIDFSDSVGVSVRPSFINHGHLNLYVCKADGRDAHYEVAYDVSGVVSIDNGTLEVMCK